MPVYNGEKLIREALDSLLAQTHTDFELIISDNASTDGTEAICREYVKKDGRIRYIRQLENRGEMANFAFVLEEAQGKYFMWAAHDDQWMPTFVAAALRTLEQNPSAVCAGPKVRLRDHRLFDVTFALVGTPRERLAAFLANPGDNSRFYGLHRIENLRSAIRGKVSQYLATDWLWLAAIAISGDMLEIPEVLMTRACGAKYKHYAGLSKWNWFPFVTFSARLLRHKEAWSMGTLLYLFKLNLGGHFYVAEMRGWRNYSKVYAAILKVNRAMRRLTTSIRHCNRAWSHDS